MFIACVRLSQLERQFMNETNDYGTFLMTFLGGASLFHDLPNVQAIQGCSKLFQGSVAKEYIVSRGVQGAYSPRR